MASKKQQGVVLQVPVNILGYAELLVDVAS